MSFTDQREVFHKTFVTADLAAAIADNTDLAVFTIPANKEIEIQNVVGYVSLASDGADFIELVKEDNTVLCKIALVSTGKKTALLADGTTAATFPIRVAPQSTTVASLLKLRADGATDATTTVDIQVHVSGFLAK